MKIERAVLMIACGAFGALTVGNVKWVWWFFGMLWFLHIIFALGKSWAEAAKAKGGESGSVYSKIAGITVITWFCYPIVWVFAEGFGNFSVTFEVSLPPLPPLFPPSPPSPSSPPPLSSFWLAGLSGSWCMMVRSGLDCRACGDESVYDTHVSAHTEARAQYIYTYVYVFIYTESYIHIFICIYTCRACGDDSVYDTHVSAHTEARA